MRISSAMLILTSMALCLTILGCTERHEAPKIVEDEYHKHSQYPFALTEDARRTFAAKVALIQIGDSRANVRGLLGEPQEDTLAAPKEPFKPPMGRFVKYDVTKTDPEISNNHDLLVVFEFDPSDHLTRIRSNVPEIPSRTAPAIPTPSHP